MNDNLLFILAAAAVNNSVIFTARGSETWICNARRRGMSEGMSICVCAVMLLSAAAGWLVARAAIVPWGLDYMSTAAYLFIIAAATQVVEIFVKAYFPDLSEKLGFYLPLAAGNSALLLLLTENGSPDTDFAHMIFRTAGTALGFTVSMTLLSGIREKTDYSDIPESFRGTPSVLLTAAIMGIAFTGFTGIF